MKIYRLRMEGDFGDADSRAFWFTRKADERDFRESLRADCLDPAARPDPTLEEFDVPTDKAGLVAFLNRHCDR